MTLPTRSDLGLEELVDTLTGYEERDIAQRFGGDVGVLLETQPTMGMRALAYVVTERGLKAADVKNPDGKAFGHAMGMSIRQVSDFFPDVPVEPNPDKPVTPVGEGDSSAD